MTVQEYFALKTAITAAGYKRDIEWAETVQDVESPDQFATEFIFVVCNSGMKAQIAQGIFNRIMDVLPDGDVSSVFGHKGKVGAIKYVVENRARLFVEYIESDDKLGYLESLPWIGSITKYHLGKNLGLDCCKPDRHLVRVATMYGLTPDAMCATLSEQTGDRIGTVDVVIWRACNLGML